MTTSTLEPVRLSATLQGEGRERTCRVSAVKVTNPLAPKLPGYVRVEILDPDDDFPDGNYELDVDGQTFRLVKRDGKYEGLA
jgi:hypothetical protein